MTDTQFQIIMDRLDVLEDAVSLSNNPARSLDIKGKALMLRKAVATGDKVKIKEAKRLINAK